MEQQKILDELAEIQRRIAEYLEILGSDKVLRALIVKELKEVQKDYGDERRTEIIEDTGEIKLEDLVAVEDVADHGDARRLSEAHLRGHLSAADARRQGPHRHGHARGGFRGAADCRVHAQLPADLHHARTRLLAEGLRDPRRHYHGKGKHITNLINLQPDEDAKAFLSVKDFVRRPVHRDGDQARRDQEVRADRVR